VALAESGASAGAAFLAAATPSSSISTPAEKRPRPQNATAANTSIRKGLAALDGHDNTNNPNREMRQPQVTRTMAGNMGKTCGALSCILREKKHRHAPVELQQTLLNY
jgi:hypothetical protein